MIFFTDIRAAVEEAQYLADTTRCSHHVMYVRNRMAMTVMAHKNALRSNKKSMMRFYPTQVEPDTKTGLRNISFGRSGKYRVRVTHAGKTHCGGTHQTLEEAIQARTELIERITP